MYALVRGLGRLAKAAGRQVRLVASLPLERFNKDMKCFRQGNPPHGAYTMLCDRAPIFSPIYEMRIPFSLK